MPLFEKQLLAGWGNVRPQVCRVYRPEKLDEVRQVVQDVDLPAAESGGATDAAPPPVTAATIIPRGLGRSYGDSAVNAEGAVLLNTRMDCLIDFDPETGVVEAESGVSLATLIDVLLPRGFFLPVTPGTKFVTLGGAIAADVHGKNHHADGTFGNFVLSLKLMTAGGEVVTCSPEQNPELFWATIGGMGLTGVIVSARLQLISVSSAYLDVTYRRAANLDRAIELFETGTPRKYSVAWIDCLATGDQAGRCVLMEAEHLPASQLSGRRARHPLVIRRRRRRTVPRFFPSFLLNRLTVRWFNKLYYLTHPDGQRIVDLDSYFYPLDRTNLWNRIYGKRGFVQYQALVPQASGKAGLSELLAAIAASGNASFLAVLKRTGEQGRGLLSFPFAGYTLALDLKNNAQLPSLMASLDAILLRHGGRLYLAKDSMMSGETFAAMYPRLDEFREIKRRVDPAHRFASSQSRRLSL